MRYGICILPEYPWREAAPLWRRAEELGFEHAWTYDHLTWEGLPDSPWHSTFATLSAAAMLTERMTLGTFVSSPNFRHPALLARDVITLDDISGGRAVLGLGAGAELDASIIGDSPTLGQRTRRFAEMVGLTHRLLTEDHVDHDGEFYTCADVRTLPGCTQQPRVPFVVAANGPQAIRLAAQYGDGWVTTGAVGPRSGGDLTLEEWWDGLRYKSAQVDRALEEVQAAGGRVVDGPLARYLSIDFSGQPALTSVGFFEEQVGRAEELGFTDVIVHWPRDTEPYRADVAVLEQLDLSGR